MSKNDFFRLCPTCGTENAPNIMRCNCGALLVGIDLTSRAQITPDTTSEDSQDKVSSAQSTPIICPHEDCAQPNPHDAVTCVYCDRDLFASQETNRTLSPLIRLPSALSNRFQIIKALPATGAEADLFIVKPVSGDGELIAKIYRHGIHPNREVTERINRINKRNRVDIIEADISDGFTYELMEYCKAGSLRNLLSAHRINDKAMLAVIRELSLAVQDVHDAELIHRDLKPENILIRSTKPLDFVLTDFGIASLQNATLRFTGVARTLAYSAPEALSGVISTKVDWWSLGMIFLECIRGKHPFAGLSDAVILLHLTTRNIDLSDIENANLRKLLRGLLQRNPEKRWGFEEIQRWLSGDTSLPEPQEESDRQEARIPYQIGKDKCSNVEELAVALTRNWQLATSDLSNGLLAKWFKESLQDQNISRFLISLNLERNLHIDVRLLRLILELAPGIPPVWRGSSLGLKEILMQADKALKSDPEAISWLDALYEYHVLDAYAAAGNVQMGDIQTRWSTILKSFSIAWKNLSEKANHAKKEFSSTPDVASMLYGTNSFYQPSARQMHAKALAAAYDERWVERLRKALIEEVSRLSLSTPWIANLGEYSAFSAAELLALESLMPEIRKIAKKSEQFEQQKEEEIQQQVSKLKTEASVLIGQINALADRTFMNDEVCSELKNSTEKLIELCNDIRLIGRTDDNFIRLKNRMARIEPIAKRMVKLIYELTENRTRGEGWFNRSTMQLGALTLFFLRFMVQRPMLLMIFPIAIVILVLWFFMPNYYTKKKIRTMASHIAKQ